MKKHGSIKEQVHLYHKFLQDREQQIKQNPAFVTQIAANYSTVDRIQQNARCELEGKAWVEDITSVPETNCLNRGVGGSIRAVDVSPDGRTIAVVSKDEEYNVKLHLLNTATGEDRCRAVDIKSLNDRVGLQARFMADNASVFVGSLTTLINMQGKQIQTGLDTRSIELKEKFSIECCDISSRYIACGLNTFPWGGRSLHLCVFDFRTKKCLKTLEILHFRYGGSSQFSVKSCALSADKPLVCACVKQTTKAQLRVTVWNISKWQVVNSIDVNNDNFTKCLFVGDGTLLMGSSVRSSFGSKGESEFVPVVSELWHYKDVANKTSTVWDTTEQTSVFSGYNDKTVCCRWTEPGSSATIQVWNSSDIEGTPSIQFRLSGLTEASEIIARQNNGVVFVGNDELFIYNLNDLDRLNQNLDVHRIPTFAEVIVDTIAFIPKTDTAIFVCQSMGTDNRPLYSVYAADLKQEDIILHPTPFVHEVRKHTKISDLLGHFKCFGGGNTSSEICFPSADGNILVFNAGDALKVWNRVSDAVTTLPTYKDLKEQFPEFEEYQGIKGVASVKDNLIAVVYGQIPFRVYLYDLKTSKLVRKVDHQQFSKRNVINDVTFLPSNGHLITYHRNMEQMVAVWNSRSGELLSSQSLYMSYAQTSPASDRIVVSVRKGKREGELVLRNSDSKFCNTIAGVGTWLPSHTDSDVSFSPDGTVLVGVCMELGTSLIWNAGNGDLLLDLSLTFSGMAEIVGMPSNTHVLLHDDRLLSVDVGSGSVTSVLPLFYRLENKTSPRGLRLSPRGTTIVGCRPSGHLAVFHCHNFATVKRKTTLQRMKSYSNS